MKLNRQSIIVSCPVVLLGRRLELSQEDLIETPQEPLLFPFYSIRWHVRPEPLSSKAPSSHWKLFSALPICGHFRTSFTTPYEYRLCFRLLHNRGWGTVREVIPQSGSSAVTVISFCIVKVYIYIYVNGPARAKLHSLESLKFSFWPDVARAPIPEREAASSTAQRLIM